MERLTEKIGNTNCVKGCGSNCKYGFQHCITEDWENCQTIDDIIDKLADYEDLEEQGLLLRLPCKVGDRLYRIDFLGFIISDTVHSIHILQNTAYLEMNYWDKDISLSEVGKTIFLTQAEAEQKLKEMESD